MTWKSAVLCLTLLLAGSGSASASLILSSEFISSSGSSDVYGIRLIGATDLATYNIEVVLQAPGLIDESMIQVSAPPSGYVFDDSSNFFPGVNVGGGQLRITLTDFSATPTTDTVAGLNDLIALITIDTSTLTGHPSFGFVADTLILDDPLGRPIAGYEQLKLSLQAVPEPSSVLLAVLGGGFSAVCAAIRACRSSKARVSSAKCAMRLAERSWGGDGTARRWDETNPGRRRQPIDALSSARPQGRRPLLPSSTRSVAGR